MSSAVEGSVSSAASDPTPLPTAPESTEEDQGRFTPKMVEVGSPEHLAITKMKSRRTRTASAPPSKDVDTVELPEDLDIFWLPQESMSVDTALPPPELLEEALNKLLITQHAQVQHRATYPTGPDTLVEPTLGLYCPIEGGDYIIDATVQELARNIGADVLVLDSMQLAAGEWGKFGKAANTLQLPVNPLHLPSESPSTSQAASEAAEAEEEDEDDAHSRQLVTLTLLAHAQGRSAATSQKPVSRSKIKVFFDTIVNSSPKLPPSDASGSNSSRPRIIYVRDFSMLAPSSSIWYPPLLSAVRQRRRGPLSRPTSPITNPITIIFGMTPSLTPSVSSGAGPSNNFVSYLMSRINSAGPAPKESKHERIDWSEADSAQKARERRLQDRLRKWEKHELALFNELPKLSSTTEGDAAALPKPEIIVLGSGPRGIPAMPPLSGGLQPAARMGGNGDAEQFTSFFRTSVLVPAKRSRSRERATRMARRREINELSMRMGVGLVGGSVEDPSAAEYFENPIEMDEDEVGKVETAVPTEVPKMWDDWGNRIEVWSNVKRIADSAVGRVLATTSPASISNELSLEPTVIPWWTVQTAWRARKSLREHKKNWLKDAGSPTAGAEEAEKPEEESTTDEVVERVRNERDLDTYEQRLLGCIVDAASMPTSFSQVHLPPHTIDSVRTIVSLPLLHPTAFQHGILKQHSMTGCLLFGPPGTGKTLVVRALAKDAGCRMLAITPSDIMDMYVGEAEKLVRAVFSLARRLSPCVVFLDEIDALFGARMSARESGGAAAAHRGVITEFMQEMDGLKSSKEDGVIVIGATNRPFDLDDAVLRRLPRRLLVDLPGEKERQGILQILLRDEVLGPDVTPELLASKTDSFSGSDLKHLCVSAALDAVKERFNVPWKEIAAKKFSERGTAAATPLTVADSDESVVPSNTTESGLETTTGNLEVSPMPEIASETKSDASPEAPKLEPAHLRVLHLRNFTKALKEITPSSSESLGSLADLRKWNDQFGEGQRDKRKSPWGRGLFGFVDARKPVPEPSVQGTPVAPATAAHSPPSSSTLEP